MQVKPLKKLNKPHYPDKYQVSINRKLLQNQPQHWRKQPLIALSFAALLSGILTACKKDNKYYGQLAGDVAYTLEISQITDEEAIRIIREELEKAGYSFSIAENQESFEFDGIIQADDKLINMEFVSYADYQNGKYLGVEADQYHYFPTQSLALQLKAKYKEMAIFYAPESFESEENIRQQVSDFINWLVSISD